MTKHLKAVIVAVSLFISLLQLSAWAVDQPKPAPPGPIPAQILTAKKVFVANAGGDEPGWISAQFSGGARRSYDQFYAAMKTWGHYDLVGAPADGDLLFEIEFRIRRLASSPDPQLRLVIRDPKTNALLWAFTEHVQSALMQENRDKNFDQAMTRIVRDIQTLTSSTDASTP